MYIENRAVSIEINDLSTDHLNISSGNYENPLRISLYPFTLVGLSTGYVAVFPEVLFVSTGNLNISIENFAVFLEILAISTENLNISTEKLANPLKICMYPPRILQYPSNVSLYIHRVSNHI